LYRTATVRMRLLPHVAIMLHGAAGTPFKSLKMLGSKLQHKRHEKGRQRGGRSRMSLGFQSDVGGGHARN
jgi:hypothetical protein